MDDFANKYSGFVLHIAESAEEDTMKRILCIAAAVILIGAGESKAQWVPSFESYHGGISSLAGRGSTVFAGANKGEIFVSNDAGTSWRLITSGEIKHPVTAIAVGDSAEFAGTNGGGLFVHKTNAAGWIHLTAGVADTIINSLLVESNGDIVAGTPHGVLISTNDGATWGSAEGLPDSNKVLSLCQNDSGTFAGTGAGGVYFSPDYGANWVERGSIGSHQITSFDTLGGRLFAATIDSGVFVSTDGGSDWNTASEGLAANLRIRGLALQGTTLIAATAIGAGGAFISADTGKTWQPVNSLADSIFSAVLSNGKNIYLSSNFGGVYYSTDDGNSWLQANLGGITNARILGFSTRGSTIFAATTDGIIRSADHGRTWSLSAGYHQYVNSIGANDSVVLAGIYPGIWRSSDDGVTWSIVDTNFTYGSCNSILYHDSTFYAARGFNVEYSRDGGLTWHVWKMPQGVDETVFDVEVIDSSIFVATGTMGVFRSSNYGASWTHCGSAINDECLTSIDSILFLGTTNGAFRSTDQGNHWLSAGLVSKTIYTLVPYKNYLFAGTDSGIYVSPDYGDSWVYDGSGLNGFVQSILVFDSTVYVGNAFDGVWAQSVNDIIQTGIRDNQGGVPLRFSLEQNYPNPFNPSTTIRYQLPANNRVTLKIYDILGREVRTLVDGREAAGTHSVTFDAADLPSGVYFYRIEAGSYQKTKKLVLLK